MTTIRVKLDAPLKFEQGRHEHAPNDGKNSFGTVWIKTGYLVADEFEIEINPELLVREIGRRALRNRNGKAQLRAGAVKVRTLNSHFEKE